MDSLFSPEVHAWIILPALVYFARVIDVSMGTVRVILISRGVRWLAPIIGFFEVIIWLLAVSQIIQNLSNVACYVAFGAGYATGVYLGMKVESRLHIGKAVLRIIAQKEASELIAKLRAANYGVTSIDAHGAIGAVTIVFSIVERRDLPAVVDMVKEFDPGAFYTVGDVKFVSEGVFPQKDSLAQSLLSFAGKRK
jgi:uncharacterized protein YebE (UPF0316 family)